MRTKKIRAIKKLAQTLFEISVQNQAVDVYFDAIHKLSSILKKNPKIINIFDAPVLTLEEKIAIIDSFLSEYDISTMPLKRAFMMISELSVFRFFDVLEKEFEAHVENYKGIIHVSVCVPEPLNDEERRAISAIFERKYKRKVYIEEIISPDLLGGLLLHVGDAVFDLSLKGKITNLLSWIL